MSEVYQRRANLTQRPGTCEGSKETGGRLCGLGLHCVKTHLLLPIHRFDPVEERVLVNVPARALVAARRGLEQPFFAHLTEAPLRERRDDNSVLADESLDLRKP